MKWDYGRHYATFHPDTPEHRAEMHAQMRRWLLPVLPADRGTPLLDVGCGFGYAVGALREAGFTCIQGIDADASQVERARKLESSVEHVLDTPAWLEGKRGIFGTVLLLDVLEHISPADHPRFLTAVAQSLRPGGTLILTTPNAAASLAGYWRYIDYTHRIAFTIPSLAFVLQHTGFERPEFHPIELAPPGWSPRHVMQRFFRFWRRLEFMAEFGQAGRRIPVTPNLLAVARKAC